MEQSRRHTLRGELVLVRTARQATHRGDSRVNNARCTSEHCIRTSDMSVPAVVRVVACHVPAAVAAGRRAVRVHFVCESHTHYNSQQPLIGAVSWGACISHVLNRSDTCKFLLLITVISYLLRSIPTQFVEISKTESRRYDIDMSLS